MNLLTKLLTMLHNDCDFETRFNLLDKGVYEEDWEAVDNSCLPVKGPDFFCKNIDLADFEPLLKGTYAQIIIDNAGYKQPHEFLLTGVMKSGKKIFLYFSSKFSRWSTKRVVIIEDAKVTRNDFKNVYKLSWKDYKEGEYQKKKTTSMVPKLRRPTLTQNDK